MHKKKVLKGTPEALKEFYQDFDNIRNAGLGVFRYFNKAEEPKSEMEKMLHELMV